MGSSQGDIMYYEYLMMEEKPEYPSTIGNDFDQKNLNDIKASDLKKMSNRKLKQVARSYAIKPELKEKAAMLKMERGC